MTQKLDEICREILKAGADADVLGCGWLRVAADGSIARVSPESVHVRSPGAGVGPQSGRTTSQMMQAPRDAFYVWCNRYLDYPKKLANFLGRTDLKVIRPDQLTDGTTRGCFVPIVVDHAADLSFNERVEMHIHMKRCSAKGI